MRAIRTKPRKYLRGQAALPVVLAYAVLAALWILVSDTVVEALFSDPAQIIRSSMIKGWLFVAVTSLLLYALVSKQVRQLQAAHRRDITEQAQSEQALRQSEERYRSVVNNIKEVIFQTDATGLWTFLNPAWTEVTGFPLETSLGTLFLDYVHPDDRQRNLELFEPLIQRKKDYCRHVIRYLHQDGGFRWIEVYARLTLDENNAIVGTSGTLTDITERKTAEVALQRHTEELERFNRAAIGRELDMIELKKQINALSRELGREPPFPLAFLDEGDGRGSP